MRGTIRARGKGRWQVQAYAGRGPDDREKRVARTIRGTKRDAERALAALVVEVEAGQHRGDDPTVAELAEQWYAARVADWSPGSTSSARSTSNTSSGVGSLRASQVPTVDCP